MINEYVFDIYVASSWRNPYQPVIVETLRAFGFKVYDFRNPNPGNYGFSWSDIDVNWRDWSTEEYIKALDHRIAQGAFKSDMSALEQSKYCILVLPCGRSAHLEAGYAVGAGKPTYIYIPESKTEPELMYKMATMITNNFDDIVEDLLKREPDIARSVYNSD